MKRITFIMLPAVLLAFVLVLGVILSNNANAKENQEVIIMLCQFATPDDVPETIFIVGHVTSSANAPSVSTGFDTNCAETLANLLSQGFKIKGITESEAALKTYHLVSK